MNFSSGRLRNSQAAAPSSSSTISLQYARRHEEGRISSSDCSTEHTKTRSNSGCTALSSGLEVGIESLKINAGSGGSRMMPTSTTTCTLPTCSNRSTQNYRQTRTSGRVRFCDAIAIREFHTLRHQYKYFYDEEDLELFGRDMKNTVKKVRKGNSSELDPDQHTLRGLEHFISKKIFKEVFTEKKRTIRLVLRAQSSGLTADEIAEICSRTTRGALARARQRGAKYQADSFLFYESVT